MVGLSPDELRELKHEDFIARVFSQPEHVRDMIEAALQTGETVSGDLELEQAGKLRGWVHCLISVQSAAPQSDLSGAWQSATAIEGVIYDVTDRKTREHAVLHRPITTL